MSQELLRLYQKIQKTPALSLAFPEEVGKGRITRLDTSSFSLSSWDMEFERDTFVEGKVTEDLRLLFCFEDGVEWFSDRERMCLDCNEACFCLSDGSPEKTCYQSKASFSFLSISMPADRFIALTGSFLPDADETMAYLPGRRFVISKELQKRLREIGPLEEVHSGFEMMRLEGRLLEILSLSLEEVLCERTRKGHLHQEDLKVIRAVGRKIEEDPAQIPDIATLAREYCMSVSKLTRDFRAVYGVSLHAYVIFARVRKGAELLSDEGLSVREAAEILGYAKPSNFSSDFRKQFGMLPSEYRLRFRSGT